MTSADAPTRTFIEKARRAQIIAAAIATVNEVGYHRASLSAVASRAGVAKSAIVYYFGTRDSLLLSVVDDVFTTLYDVVAAQVPANHSPTSQLRDYAHAYLAFIDQHRAEAIAAIEIVVSHRTEDGTPLYLTGSADDSPLLRDILAAGMDTGEFRKLPLHVAVSVVESVLDVWTTELQRNIDADLGEFAAPTIALLLAGLARPQ